MTFFNLFFFLPVALTILYSALIFLFFLGWKKNKIVTSGIPANKTKITVIVPAKNEEKNITACLNCLAKQEYPASNYEIIVGNDRSTDATAAKVSEFIRAEPTKNIRMVEIHGKPADISGKKNAITECIRQSHGELIITTDSDCVMGKKWASSIADFYEKSGAAMIIGPVVTDYILNKSSTGAKPVFFPVFQYLDFCGFAGVTGGSTGWHHPILCSGANLAFRKDIFNEVNGYSGFETIDSGDDVFLMYKFAKIYRDKILFLKNRETVVTTRAAGAIRDFFRQRTRWGAKSVYFRKPLPVFTAIVTLLTSWSLSVLLLFSIVDVRFFFLFLMSMLLKSVADLVLLFSVCSFFRNRKALLFFPVAQIFHIFYVTFAGLNGLLMKSRSWNK